MPRIILTITNTELSELLKLAHSQLRTPKDQLRFILQKELIQLELINQKTNPPINTLSVASVDSEQENQ